MALLPGDYLVGYLSVQLSLFHNSALLKIFQHCFYSRFVLDTEMADELAMCLNCIRRSPEIRDEIQNINFFHDW
jgi:hypothetical protein